MSEKMTYEQAITELDLHWFSNSNNRDRADVYTLVQQLIDYDVLEKETAMAVIEYFNTKSQS